MRLMSLFCVSCLFACATAPVAVPTKVDEPVERIVIRELDDLMLAKTDPEDRLRIIQGFIDTTNRALQVIENCDRTMTKSFSEAKNRAATREETDILMAESDVLLKLGPMVERSTTVLFRLADQGDRIPAVPVYNLIDHMMEVLQRHNVALNWIVPQENI